MEVKQGFKLTELGVIPEEWKVVRLAELSSMKSGEGITSSKINQYSQFPCYGGNGLRGFTSRYTHDGDFALIGRQGALCGNVVGVTGKFYASEHAVVVTPRNGTDIRFLTFVLGEMHLNRLSEASAQPGLSVSKLLSLYLAAPSSALEQHAIATALSDVDALLAGLDRLIAKKRDLKQAVMQQLLSGRTRLPGFRDEWEVKRLDSIAEIRSGGTPSTGESCFWDGEIPWCTPTDITALDGRKFLSETARNISQLGLNASSAEMIPSFSVVMTSRATIGECAINTVPVSTNQGFKNFVPLSTTDVTFLYYVLGIQKQGFISLCGGSTFLEIGKSQLAAYRIRMPSTKSEQSAIASVLCDMDEELVAIEQRRDKTRALKQAMMQELLSGRTRLVTSDAATDEEAPAPTNGRQANIYFTRSVLAAEIIDRLHDQPTFGHVKFEKLLFLVERLCGIDTGSTYYRQAAGPYDNRALRSIDSQLRKQQWFEARKEGKRYHYLPMKNRGGHRQYFNRYFSGIGVEFDKLLETFKTTDTERCEIVATLFAAWDDLLQGPEPVTNDRIVNEVLNHWHEAKQRISEERWRNALAWMRKEGFVPRGSLANSAATSRP